MFITDSQDSPLKNISDISGNLAYRGRIISGIGTESTQNIYLYNEISGGSIRNGLVSWIEADSSSSVIDRVTNQVPTIYNGLYTSTGLKDYAMLFTGTNYLVASGISEADPRVYSDGFTVMSWIYPTQQVAGGIYVGRAEKSYYLYYYSYDEWKIAFDTRADAIKSSTYLTTYSEVCPLNTWKMICASYHPDQKSIFWNPTGQYNIKVNTTSDYRAFISPNSNDSIIIGAGISGYLPFRGLINSYATWNRVLTPKEMSWLYNNGSGRSYSEIVQTGINTLTTVSATGCYLSLIGSGGQYINSGTPTPVLWNSITRKQNLAWNSSNPSRIYINNFSGYYNISADVSLYSNSIFDSYYWIKNGNKSLSNNNTNIANTYLDSGDYLEFYINSYTGSYISGNCSADIIRIPDSVTNLPNNNTGYLYNDGNGNLSWNNKDFIRLTTSGGQIFNPSVWTPVYWSGSNLQNNILHTGSKIYIKKDGFYNLSSSLQMTAGNLDDMISFLINGSTYISNENNSTYTYRRKSINNCYYLTGNSYIELYIYSVNGGTLEPKASWNNWPICNIVQIN